MTTTPPSDTDIRRLIVSYAAACSALLAVLALVVVYGLFINKTELVALDKSESDSAATGMVVSGWVAPPESPDNGVDGPIAFTVRGFEVDAGGESIVVNLTVTNIGDAPTTFMGAFQTLKAGGDVYHVDDEATSRLGGGVTELEPGDKADVALAFTVPAGTAPEAVELHADPVSAGVVVPLS